MNQTTMNPEAPAALTPAMFEKLFAPTAQMALKTAGVQRNARTMRHVVVTLQRLGTAVLLDMGGAGLAEIDGHGILTEAVHSAHNALVIPSFDLAEVLFDDEGEAVILDRRATQDLIASHFTAAIAKAGIPTTAENMRAAARALYMLGASLNRVASAVDGKLPSVEPIFASAVRACSDEMRRTRAYHLFASPKQADKVESGAAGDSEL